MSIRWLVVTLVAAFFSLVGMACSANKSPVPTPVEATVQAMSQQFGCWQAAPSFVAASLGRLIQSATLVARVRITRVARTAVNYADVVQTFKGAEGDAPIRFVFADGTCLQPSAEYIVFLAPIEAPEPELTFGPPGAVGPQAVFRIDGDRIHAGDELGGSIGIREYDGMSVSEFENLIQQ